MNVFKKLISWLFSGTYAIAGDDTTAVVPFDGINCALSHSEFGSNWEVTINVTGRDGKSRLVCDRVFKSMADAIKFINEFDEGDYYRLLARDMQCILDPSKMKQFLPDLTQSRTIIIRGGQGTGKTILAKGIIGANGKFPGYVDLSSKFWPEQLGQEDAVALVDGPEPSELNLTCLKHLIRSDKLEINLKGKPRTIMDRPPMVACVSEYFPIPTRGNFKLIDLGDSPL